MENSDRCKEFNIEKIHEPVIRAGGYAKLQLLPIEFTKPLHYDWVQSFKEHYEALSSSKSEDILFQPVNYDLADWDKAPLERVLFLALNQPGIQSDKIEPDPNEAIEWLKKALDRANGFYQQTYCQKNQADNVTENQSL